MLTCLTSRSSFRVYEEHVGGSFRVAELVSLRAGRRMAANGAAKEGVDQDGSTPCFIRCEISGRQNRPLGLRSTASLEPVAARSSTAFTMPEMNALAGTNFRHGRSRTANLTEEQRKARLDRRGKPLPTEDLVERATNKKLAWEQLGPALQELVSVVPSLGA